MKWETVEDYNFGIDYGLFDNRLTGSFEYYIKNTKDMLFRKLIPVIPATRVMPRFGQM